MVYIGSFNFSENRLISSAWHTGHSYQRAQSVLHDYEEIHCSIVHACLCSSLLILLGKRPTALTKLRSLGKPAATTSPPILLCKNEEREFLYHIFRTFTQEVQ